MQKRFVDAVHKIAGDATGVQFDANLPHAAQYEAAKKLVTFAANKSASMSNAAHEAFHVVYEHYITPDQRRIIYKAFRDGPVKAKLKELLKDSPEAWQDARNDPGELAAYAFQFWNSGELKLGPENHNVFTKIADLWTKAWNWLRDEPGAEELLHKVAEGYFANGGPSPAEIALSQAQRPLARVRTVTSQATKFVDKIYESALYPFDSRVRDYGNPHLDALAKAMYAQVGEKTGQRGLVQEMPAQIKGRLNALDRIARDPSGSFGTTLGEMARGGDKAATDQAMAQKIRGWLNEQHRYMREAGVNIGHEKDYVPMSWDGAKIAAKRGEFVDMLTRHQSDIDALNERLRTATGKSGRNFEELTPQSIADMMSRRGTATDEFLGSAYDEHGAPNADFTLNRVFGFLKNEDRAPFVHDDLASGLQRYAKQAVRRAEWTRRFGEQGEKWNAQLDKARSFGMTEDQGKLLQDYKDAAFGAKLHDMNPTLRKVLAANTVYQNYRVLGLSVLGNLLDPMGVAVRSGEMSEAFESYKLAVQRVFKSGRLKHADLQDLAETIGSIERNGVADSIAGLYGGVNIEGTLRKANDALFNYNGMNGLNRSVRLAALSAGMRYVARHAQEGGVARNLEELGLRKDDVQLHDDGRLKVLESDGLTREQSQRIQTGLNRFVDEAALNPNAGERTAWGANPLFAPLYHLKQYVFTFNKVINKKLEHELLEHGNVTPYMMAATYIPIMSASSMLRDLITHGGTLPAQNGFLHYVWDQGVMRTGLMGPSDMAELAAGGITGGDINKLREVLGPTADQAMDAFGAISSESHVHKFGDFVKESAPLGSILQHY